MAVVSIKNKLRRGNLLVGNDPFIPNSYESIATVTVGSGGASSVTFNSIGTDWTHLQIRWLARTDRAFTLDGVRINFNSDTTAVYTIHNVYGDGSNAGVNAAANTNYGFLGNTSGASKSANIFGVGVTDILDYANTNKFKTIRTLSGDDGNSATNYGYVSLNSSLWRSTSAITSITIDQESGSNFVQHSHFALYGIKGA